MVARWLTGRASDLCIADTGFDSRPGRCRVRRMYIDEHLAAAISGIYDDLLLISIVVWKPRLSPH